LAGLCLDAAAALQVPIVARVTKHRSRRSRRSDLLTGDEHETVDTPINDHRH
jgi:hypothetical protein